MAPLPQEARDAMEVPPRSEEVVISGMSGMYPECYSVKELSDVLYNKVNPVNDENRRWVFEHPEMSHFVGKIPDLSTFDAQFFKVHYRLGNSMDAMSRKLLEQAYQAIYDAGLSPEHLSGKKVGVYVGSCFSETEKASFYVASIRTGFGIAGCSKAMFANRISYWLNAKGPSMSIDAACSSSMIALERAYEAISRGDCEAAIVGGTNICLHPQSSIHYGRIMTLCKDGKTKSFDKNADGCARSEAINVLFLQKSKDAKRVYAKVKTIKSEFSPVCGEKLGQKYGHHRNPEVLSRFITDCYKDVDVSPSAVEYVEAFGLGIPESDTSELAAIGDAFCRDRQRPLLVGSVASNIGYTEAASGISSITKVLLGYHTGKLAGNLHCTSPRDDIPALADGRMKIVTDHHHFDRSYVAVNSISVSGLNVHSLFDGQKKVKDLTKYRSSIPHLVMVSGRQESAVHRILDELKANPVDPEQIGLLHGIHEHNISGHLGRGYSVLDTNAEGKTVSLLENVDYCDVAKKPLWFVYSGMGSQWVGMGTQLMRIPIFAAAIEKCRKVLEPKGVDIVNVLTSEDKGTFTNILHSFVGIAAVQIGLTDILAELGIKPDKIIGHSVGELGCGYADGCLTAEEMILAAYSRGLVSVQTPFIRGSMAAVGLGYKQIISMCPPEIVVACHNSAESSTISGPAEAMKEFVASLTAQGIFAKEVPCSNIAYHSRYIKEAGPTLLQMFRDLIKTPKPRSDKWVSTSVPQDKWDEPAAKLCSAEYHTNNLLNPVLFEETSALIPSDAVLIEIAPHGLLQAILKRALPSTCINVPLTRRGHADNTLFLLDAIGKLYMQGYNPNIKALYPKIEYPVSDGTPMMSHMIEWAHTEKWSLALYVAARKRNAAACRFVVSLFDDEHSYLNGNAHGNEILYPFAGALVNVWDTLSMSSGAPLRTLPVQFRDVKLLQPPRMRTDAVLRLSVQIHKGNGYFEVLDETATVITGYIFAINAENALPANKVDVANFNNNELNLSSSDVYKMFHDRGSYYRGEFRSIMGINDNITKAKLAWKDNWVTFLDSIFQIGALKRDHRGMSQPTFIRRLYIDLEKHVTDSNQKDTIDAEISDVMKIYSSGGVTIEDMQYQDLPVPKPEKLDVNAFKFVPYIQENNVKVADVLSVFLQIAGENINKEVINVAELKNTGAASLQDEIKSLNTYYGTDFNYSLIDEKMVQNLKSFHLVIVYNLSKKTCETLFKTLPSDMFVLNIETNEKGNIPQSICRTVASAMTPRGFFVLSRWRPAAAAAASICVSVRSTADLGMLASTRQSLKPDHELTIITSYPAPSGLKDLVRKWRREPERNRIQIAMLKDINDQTLSMLPNFDLAYNVLNNNTWGGEFYWTPEELQPLEKNMSLRCADVGDLDSLYWEEVAKPSSYAIDVAVHYAGLSVKDAKKAAGLVPYQTSDADMDFGMDYSGVTDSGERVMGVVKCGSASSRVAAEPAFLWPVPKHWSLEDAATVPLPYAHAFYCLGIKCTLARGQRILIHGASGAFGQAVISIALAHDCEVFATVSDVRKKHFLRKIYPDLLEDHIGNSQDGTFYETVMHLTKGKGVDIALCCVEGNLCNDALKCSGFLGVTLDVQHTLNQGNFQFGLFNLTMERHYHTVDFSSLFRHENLAEMKTIQLMMSTGIARGYVRPLSRVVYQACEAARGLRLLESRRHRGRVLLNLQQDKPAVTPRVSVTSDTCHVLVATCADDVLTAKLGDMLIARGVTKMVVCRQQDGYMKTKIKLWQKFGVLVKTVSANLAQNAGVESMMAECKKLGPVEGFYIVITGSADDKKQVEINAVVENLDAATRKFCPNIRYFAVIGEDTNIGQNICIARNEEKLPSKSIHLPKLKQFEEAEPATVAEISCHAALRTVERALLSLQPAVVASPPANPWTVLVDGVCAVADITINETTPDETKLGDLCSTPEQIAMAQSYLREKYNYSLDGAALACLTVGRLRELQCTWNTSLAAAPTGLAVLCSHVDPDELIATHDLVFIPTATQASPSRDDEFNVEETYLILIPGVDGHHWRFRGLCERLKLPAAALQPGLDYPDETVEQMALRFYQVLMKKLKPKQQFFLLGYSYGVLVALELAAMLEANGYEGVIYCVDSSPDSFPVMMERLLTSSGVTNDLQLQNSVIRHMYRLMAGDSSAELDAELLETNNWKEKVDACVRELRGHVTHSSQYARSLIAAAYMRIKQARLYRPKNLSLRSQVVVMRSKSHPASAPADLGLSAHTQRPPIVYQLDTDHACALDDLRCANIVNRHLSAEILDKFTKRNLCESYLLNASKFMSSSNEMEDD